jgi:large subunit ribosomal protein L30
MAKKLKVTQIKSLANRAHDQRLTVAGLGLRGVHHSVVVENTPSFRGMIKKVIHLVQVEETDV